MTGGYAHVFPFNQLLSLILPLLLFSRIFLPLSCVEIHLKQRREKIHLGFSFQVGLLHERLQETDELLWVVHEGGEGATRLRNLIFGWCIGRTLLGCDSLRCWLLRLRPGSTGHIPQGQETSETLHGTGRLCLGLWRCLHLGPRAILPGVVSLEELCCSLGTMSEQNAGILHQVVISLAGLA